MSNEVKRFSPEYCEAGGVGWAEMQEDAEGAWRKASDYDALEAECERFRELAKANGRALGDALRERDALAAELAAIRAAGGEQVEVVAWMWRDLNGDVQFNYMHPEGQELMTVAQHRRIVSNILGAAKDDQPE